MTIKGKHGSEGDTYTPVVLGVITAILLFPFLWLGITVNFFGLAERFSILPGISREGGVMSGVVALLLTTVILGSVVGGILAAFGGGVPMIGGGNDSPSEGTSPTPSPTPTPTTSPTLTETHTSTSTPTAPMTPTPEQTDLEKFETNLRGNLQYTVENDTLTPIPVLATEHRETEDGTTELWVIYRECDDLESAREQRFSTAIEFANIAGRFEGEKPERLRAYGVLSLESHSSAITTIPTTSAEAAFNESMDRNKYAENWHKKLREPTDTESEIAYEMVVNDSGQEKAEQVFEEQYPIEESDSDCPGTPEDDNKSDTDRHVSGSGAPIAAEPVRP